MSQWMIYNGWREVPTSRGQVYEKFRIIPTQGKNALLENTPCWRNDETVRRPGNPSGLREGEDCEFKDCRPSSNHGFPLEDASRIRSRPNLVRLWEYGRSRGFHRRVRETV